MVAQSHPLPISRRLRRAVPALVNPLIHAASARPEADRYRKHFTTDAHLQILLDHALSGSDSLRQTHAGLDLAAENWAAYGLAQRVSLSQLARSSTSRPSACLETVAQGLLVQVPVRRGDPILSQTWVRDSSFFTLSAKRSPWSRHGKHVPGIRVHTDYDLARAVPTRLDWTTADTHDLRHLAETDLTELAGWTVVMDVGYYGHALFQRLLAHGVDFVIPRQPQASVQYETFAPIGVGRMTPNGDRIVRDVTITLGSPNNRHGTVLPHLRLITSCAPNGTYHSLITSRLDLLPEDVVMLYHQRWQIELFFRAVKHQMGGLHPLGTSPEAVWATILLAIICWALQALLEDLQPPAVTNVAWLRAIAQNLTPHLRFSG
jgi:hypothetical protein